MKSIKMNIPKYDRRYDYFAGENGVNRRTTKTWWRPFRWVGRKMQKILYKTGSPVYSKYIWWIRRNLTHD